MTKRTMLLIVGLVASLCVSAETVQVKIGKEYHLDYRATARIQLSSATWYSEDPTIARVTEPGFATNTMWCTVVGVSKGVTFVHCYYSGTDRITGNPMRGEEEYRIEVLDGKPVSITLSPNPLEVDQGSTSSLNALIMPNDAEWSSVTWASRNTAIATVSGQGESATVRGVGVGETTITATCDNGTVGSCRVIVYGTNPTSLTLSTTATEFEPETMYDFSYNFYPSNQRSPITWTTSDASVADLVTPGYDETLWIRTYKPGTAIITGKTANGLTASLTINVTSPALEIRGWGTNEGTTTDVSVEAIPYVNFNKPAYPSAHFDEIILYVGDWQTDPVTATKVSGKVSWADQWHYTLQFEPDELLWPRTNYVLYIPDGALQTEYGRPLEGGHLFDFNTGRGKTMTLTASVPGGTIDEPTSVALTCSEPDAIIEYSLDTATNYFMDMSKAYKYSSPIIISKTTSLRVLASKRGFETIYKEWKFTANFHLVDYNYCYPYFLDELPYNTSHTTPFVRFDEGGFEPTKYFNDENLFMMTHPGYEDMAGEFLISNDLLVFVPAEPFKDDEFYVMYVESGVMRNASHGLNESFFYYVFRGTASEPAPLEGVRTYHESLTVNPGTRTVVVAFPVPYNADYDKWQWTSSDTSVATVDSRGVVTALKEGTCTITITTDNGYSDSCRLIVGTRVVEDVNADGTVDTQDVLHIYTTIQNADSSDNSGDINADGTTDTQDVLKVYEYIQQH
ncbi:MAG: Ig-like domain-containing protein [Bacteroidaceae bacterium]|nr:Ig-like domain-containing protein [Bacteroidaceae bacterium]